MILYTDISEGQKALADINTRRTAQQKIFLLRKSLLEYSSTRVLRT
jgi:hypothetical protein